MSKQEKHKWEFAGRFRRHAFGWKSRPAIQRIKEAVSEIKKVARRDAVLAGEGAVLFLEKVAAAIEHVDSSSGSMGTAVSNAIDALVPIIVAADADDPTRDAWIERLWDAYLDDEMPYIELLADSFGEMCVSPERASRWTDRLLPALRAAWTDRRPGDYFKGAPACLSCLLAAGRHDELLDVLQLAPHGWWHYRKFGVRALAATGRVDEALAYAEESQDLGESQVSPARTCEAILLAEGRADEAYERFAIRANLGTNRLATFRAIAKKYPDKKAGEILADLIRSSPGDEGKWFATAKSLELYDLAVQLANRSPCDPKTLNRAARDHVKSNPEFAIEAAMASLRWLCEDYGYDIMGLDVHAPYDYAMNAARILAREQETQDRVKALVSSYNPSTSFVRQVLGRRLGL